MLLLASYPVGQTIVGNTSFCPQAIATRIARRSQQLRAIEELTAEGLEDLRRRGPLPEQLDRRGVGWDALRAGETDKARTDAMSMEVFSVADQLCYYAKNAEKFLKPRKRKIHGLLGLMKQEEDPALKREMLQILVVMGSDELNEKTPVAPIDMTAGLSCPLLGIFGNDAVSDMGWLGIIAAIALAAGLWLAAATLFSTLEETASKDVEDAEGVSFDILRDNPDLWRFIIVRGLLVSTALAPPYLVVLANSAGLTALGQLGVLVLASAIASFLSSYVWGRMADRSSRKVLMRTGVLGALAMLGAVVLAVTGLAAEVWAMPAVLFLLMIAYHGVRQGRSTYLVDFSPADQRSAYAAVSNTVIGVLLLVAGALGGGASFLGPEWTLAGFAVMALAASVVAIKLPEAQEG